MSVMKEEDNRENQKSISIYLHADEEEKKNSLTYKTTRLRDESDL